MAIYLFKSAGFKGVETVERGFKIDCVTTNN